MLLLLLLLVVVCVKQMRLVFEAERSNWLGNGTAVWLMDVGSARGCKLPGRKWHRCF